MTRIPLTQDRFALVDDEDVEKVLQFSWHAHKRKSSGCWYAMSDFPGRTKARRYTPLHRFVMNALPGEEIDHRNGDGLDCQKQNLRRVTQQQNKQGFTRKCEGCTSPFRGVSWDKARGLWAVRLKADGKQLFLGRFDDEMEAAKAYDSAAFTHFGEFASPNFK